MRVIKNIARHFHGFMYVCNRDYKIEFINNNLIELIGYNATGELCYEAIQGLDEACPWCPNTRVFKGEIVCLEIQSLLNNRWYYSVNTPLFSNKNDETLKMSIFIDITEKKLTGSPLVSETSKGCIVSAF